MSDPQPSLRRVLGLTDLSLFLVAALVNLNSVPVVAGAGPAALTFWLAGFTLFLIPQTIAVLELSRRYPSEGGIYVWSKKAFGEFHGFLSGWCYWTNNIFYVPTLLLYIIGFAIFVGGGDERILGDSPLFMVAASLALLWGITGLNILGLKVGKWIQNLGAGGTFGISILILIVGAISLSSGGTAIAITPATMLPSLGDWRTLSLFSIVCLNYVGLELGAVLGDEIREPRRIVPRAAIIAAVATVVMYLSTTAALQASIPTHEIGVIDGVLQAVQRVASSVHLPWIVLPIAGLMIMNAAGNTSAWLGGSARIPFVIGIDRYLPAVIGRVHPRYGTPYVALVVQGIASSVFILVNGLGSSVHDMYLSLLQTTVVLQLIPYLYMFGALVRVRLRGSRFTAEEPFFRRGAVCYVAGIVGGVVTAAGIALAFVPAIGVDDTFWFEVKIALGVLSFILPALLISFWRNRKAKPAVVPEIGIAPE